MFPEHKVITEEGITGILSPVNYGEPLVLMLHGFISEKDEVGDMYKRLAEALAGLNIGSFRFDFRGCGESVGNLADITIWAQLNDTETIYTHLISSHYADPARLGIIGFSLGAGIATLTAGAHPERYQSMVQWSPIGNFKADFLGSLGEENFARAALAGEVIIDLGWKVVTLKNSFFSSLDEYDVKTEVEKYFGAFLAIACAEDSSAQYVECLVKCAAGRVKEALVIEGGDHIFGALSRDQTIAEAVIRRTAMWFRETL